MLTANRVRVAAIQYGIRPVHSIDGFREQVSGLVAAAVDNDARFVVLPEYFTTQLLTLGDIRRPMPEQVRDLANHAPMFAELMSGLAKRHGVHLVAGSIPVTDPGDDRVFNDAFVFGPSGSQGSQGKLHMTRWEAERWGVSPRDRLRVFEADFGRFAVAICYDAEFPEVARAAARAGCHLLVVPSCTDDRQGFLRVRYCAMARAIENQMYVVQAPTVGGLAGVPSAALHYGKAGLFTPCDFAFARDGILAEGDANVEMMVLGDLDFGALAASHEQGTVLPLRDSVNTDEVTRTIDVVTV